MYSRTITLLAALVASAFAATIQIDVGKTGLTFSPNNVTAAVGDVLAFTFYSPAHTVVQGDYSTPCQQGSLGSSGFGSGPISGAGYVFSVTVKSTDPIWFYCSVSVHCASGMAGVVNPPSSGNTLSGYLSGAKSASSAQGVSSPQGGTLALAGSGSSGSSASGSSTPAAASSTGSAASAPGTASATQTKASSTASATAAATTTSGGMALMETSEKIALTSVMVGLGLLVMLMV